MNFEKLSNLPGEFLPTVQALIHEFYKVSNLNCCPASFMRTLNFEKISNLPGVVPPGYAEVLVEPPSAQGL